MKRLGLLLILLIAVLTGRAQQVTHSPSGTSSKTSVGAATLVVNHGPVSQVKKQRVTEEKKASENQAPKMGSATEVKPQVEKKVETVVAVESTTTEVKVSRQPKIKQEEVVTVPEPVKEEVVTVAEPEPVQEEFVTVPEPVQEEVVTEPEPVQEEVVTVAEPEPVQEEVETVPEPVKEKVVTVWEPESTDQQTIVDNPEKVIYSSAHASITADDSVPDYVLKRMAVNQSEEVQEQFTIRPNPTADNFIIQFRKNPQGHSYAVLRKADQVQLASGQLLGLSCRISMHDYPAGEYLLRITDLSTRVDYLFTITKQFLRKQ